MDVGGLLYKAGHVFSDRKGAVMVTNKDYCLLYSQYCNCMKVISVLGAITFNLAYAKKKRPHDWHMLYIGTEKECEKQREEFMPLIDDTPF